MACRVGITTDLNSRLEYWLRVHPNLHSFRGGCGKHAPPSAQAQAYESYYADRLGCVAHPGGDGPEQATWYVYMFEY